MMAASERMLALRQRMLDTGADLLALGPGPNMHWVLGFHTHPDERPCLLLITADRAGFLMPALNVADAMARCDLPMWTWSDADGPDLALQQALHDLQATAALKVAVDETMRADFALLLLDALPEASRSFAAETLGALRMCKSASEQAELRRNAAIDDAAMQAAFAAVRPGVTERDIAEAVLQAFKDQGAAPLFCIVGAGPNAAYPHHQTGDTVLTEGAAIVVDIGARSGDFSSDLTRMVTIGTPPAEYALVHATVEAAVLAALQAARPGVKACSVDQAARAVIEAAGYGPYFVHRTGHGMGLEGHEPPYISEGSETVLSEGMVFSIEPGIYLPGKFGVRLEEIVILQADGPEILSQLPRAVMCK
jgi:Xaa-Pro aminopeptidase